MSAPRRFTVSLMVGRTLTLTLAARDEQAAEDIASWLYQEHGDRFFVRHAEAEFDCITTPAEEPAS